MVAKMVSVTVGSPRGPEEDALQHGLTGDIGKDLPRQARGGHASLNDGNNSWFHRYMCTADRRFGKSVPTHSEPPMELEEESQILLL